MDAERAFSLLNLVVMPWWAVWIVAPRSRWARRAAAHGAVFVALAAVYTALLVATFASSEVAGFDFESMRAGLGTPLGFLAGWTHYLCFDLFVGAWILRESRRLALEPRPYLVFALMLCPIGLGAFLVRRAFRLRSLGQIGEVDLA